MYRVYCRGGVTCFPVFPSLKLWSKAEEESDLKGEGRQRGPWYPRAGWADPSAGEGVEEGTLCD